MNIRWPQHPASAIYTSVMQVFISGILAIVHTHAQTGGSKVSCLKKGLDGMGSKGPSVLALEEGGNLVGRRSRASLF